MRLEQNERGTTLQKRSFIRAFVLQSELVLRVEAAVCLASTHGGRFASGLWLNQTQSVNKNIIHSNLLTLLALLVIKQPHSDRRTTDKGMPANAATSPTHAL